MRLISADFIYTPESLLEGHCLELTEGGEVLALRPVGPGDEPEHLNGILCPGLVNAHCHSELSMMEGHTTEGAGMAKFVKQIITSRGNFTVADQEEAVIKAFQYMWDAGTVLLGDICNAAASLKAKRSSPLASHSFVEVFSLGEDQAQATFESGLSLMKEFEGLPVSLTHHAPYTMSRGLIRKVFEYAAEKGELLSIHLLECEAERAIFEKNEGPFIEVFKMLGIPFEQFEADTAQDHLFADMPADQPALFIHNTEMTEAELDSIATAFPNASFCLCPRSNYFIHRTCPDADMFARYRDRICLGTDSIASNYDLDLFEEVKVLHKRHPNLSLHTLLSWATTNGAQALQQAANFGTFAPGTTPGVNLIEGIETDSISLTEASRLVKIA